MEIRKINLMKVKHGVNHLAGIMAFIKYGDAKDAGIRQYDMVQVYMEKPNGEIEELEGLYEVDEYITFRQDTQQTFKGFAMTRFEM